MLASLAEEVESSFWNQESKINHSTHNGGKTERECRIQTQYLFHQIIIAIIAKAHLVTSKHTSTKAQKGLFREPLAPSKENINSTLDRATLHTPGQHHEPRGRQRHKPLTPIRSTLPFCLTS